MSKALRDCTHNKFGGERGSVWLPREGKRDQGPPTVTSYQVHLWNRYAHHQGIQEGTPWSCKAPTRTTTFTSHEWHQVSNMWLLEGGDTARRPMVPDVLRWMGLTGTGIATAVQTAFPCLSTNYPPAPDRTQAPDTLTTHVWHAPWDGLCTPYGLCANCAQAWELLGQGWHLPSIMTVMEPWAARSLDMHAAGPQGGDNTWGWEHPPHVCGHACHYLQPAHTVRTAH